MAKKSDLLTSFNAAFRGFLYVVKRERNFRIHLCAGVIVIIGSLFLNLPITEFLILILIITFVLITELTNTLIEMLIDNFVQEYNVRIKRIKDIGAALVLISATSSVIIGYLILAKHFPPNWKNAFESIGKSPWYITFVALIIISSLAIFLKFILKRGSLLTGGMPSIHSGIAFSIWTTVTFLTFKKEPLISLLVFLLAFWVAQSRILRKIHKIEEVIIGAILGILITVIIFQIFWR